MTEADAKKLEEIRERAATPASGTAHVLVYQDVPWLITQVEQLRCESAEWKKRYENEVQDRVTAWKEAEQRGRREVMTLPNAIAVLAEALRTDGGYRQSWLANIAMAFKDTADQQQGASVHYIANVGAERFLDLLCYDQLSGESGGGGGK